MTQVTPYLFVPAIRDKNLSKALEISKNSTSKIIFDLEDSVGDLNDINISGELKEKARQKLFEFLKNNPIKFLIRTNDVNSIFWKKDKSFLLQLTKIINFNDYCDGIVMAKTNNDNELITFINWWNQNSDVNLRIIPLIETVEGLKNLNKISNVKQVVGLVFGHHDYFLDYSLVENKIVFPVPSSPLTSEIYRKILDRFVAAKNQTNKNLTIIDGVYSYLYDIEGIKNIGCYIYNLEPNISWGKLVLNPKQFDALNELKDSPPFDKKILSSFDDNFDAKEKNKLANKLASRNTVHSDLKVTRIKDRYVSPQERLLAEKYLDSK